MAKFQIIKTSSGPGQEPQGVPSSRYLGYNFPMYQIVQAPSEILRTPAKGVGISGDALAKIISEMKVALIAQKDPEGVGLAATQVGLPYRLFLARFDTKKNSPIYTFINPEIVDHSKEFATENKKTPLEGCLSLPLYYGYVKRWKWVKVRYQTINDNQKNRKLENQKNSQSGTLESWTSGTLVTREETFSDFPATVIQHEIDHLDGKIFVERILSQNGRLYKNTGKDKGGKDKWEEVEL